MNNKKLWYPAAMVIALSVAASAAQAKSLEQVGTSESRAEPLKTYGVDVAAKSGLKTLLPSGWNLFIYKNTNLPQSISWSVGDTWMSALEKFADKNSLAVRLDWTKKAVYISSPEVAIESRAKLAEINNAARTPLPVYAPAATVLRVAAAAPTTAAPMRPTVTVQPNVTVQPVKVVTVASPAARASTEPRMSSDLLARALAATAPKSSVSVPAGTTSVTVSSASPVVISTTPASPVSYVAVRPATAPLPPLPYTMPLPQSNVVVASRVIAPVALEPGSDAFVRGNLEDIVRATAAKLGYQVSWETVSLPLNGPVTFLGVDAAEDMRLLQKSLGLRQSPIAIEVYRGSSVIRVSARGPGREPLSVYNTTYSGLVGFGPRPSSSIAAVAAPLPAVSQTTWIDTVASSSHVPPTATPTAAATRPVVIVTDAPVRIVQAEIKAPIAVAPSKIVLKIAKGDSLSKAIAQFLKTQGWELKWQVPNDMEAEFPFTAEGTTVAKVLGQLLPGLGLDTDMYAPSKMVVVRPIDNTAE